MSTKKIFNEALALTALERAVLVEQLLISLDEPDCQIDEHLANEVERRINEYENGEIRSVSASLVFSKLEKN